MVAYLIEIRKGICWSVCNHSLREGGIREKDYMIIIWKLVLFYHKRALLVAALVMYQWPPPHDISLIFNCIHLKSATWFSVLLQFLFCSIVNRFKCGWLVDHFPGPGVLNFSSNFHSLQSWCCHTAIVLCILAPHCSWHGGTMLHASSVQYHAMDWRGQATKGFSSRRVSRG